MEEQSNTAPQIPISMSFSRRKVINVAIKKQSHSCFPISPQCTAIHIFLKDEFHQTL
jgi:hypothetical protein